MIDHDLYPRPREGEFPHDNPRVGGPIRVRLKDQLEVTELPFSHEKSPVTTFEIILPTHESMIFHGPDRRPPRSVLPMLLREGGRRQFPDCGSAYPQWTIDARRREPSGQIPTVEEALEPSSLLSHFVYPLSASGAAQGSHERSTHRADTASMLLCRMTVAVGIFNVFSLVFEYQK